MGFIYTAPNKEFAIYEEINPLGSFHLLCKYKSGDPLDILSWKIILNGTSLKKCFESLRQLGIISLDELRAELKNRGL